MKKAHFITIALMISFLSCTNNARKRNIGAESDEFQKVDTSIYTMVEESFILEDSAKQYLIDKYNPLLIDTCTRYFSYKIRELINKHNGYMMIGGRIIDIDNLNSNTVRIDWVRIGGIGLFTCTDEIYNMLIAGSRSSFRRGIFVIKNCEFSTANIEAEYGTEEIIITNSTSPFFIFSGEIIDFMKVY